VARHAKTLAELDHLSGLESFEVDTETLNEHVDGAVVAVGVGVDLKQFEEQPRLVGQIAINDFFLVALREARQEIPNRNVLLRVVCDSTVV